MSRRVRSTLLALGGGALAQRGLQFLTTIALARSLGAAGLGTYAYGLSFGLLLTVLCDSGIRAIAAREIAATPRAAAWIRASIRARFLIAVPAYALYAGGVVLVGAHPLFYLLCGASVFPAILDLKGIADAIGRAPREVLFEGLASALYFLMVVLAVFLGALDLTVLAAAYLAARALYALLALSILPPREAGERPIAARGLLIAGGGLSIAQLLGRMVHTSDTFLLMWLAGPSAAGLYNVAQRLALAAQIPINLLGRLFLPHLQHAVAAGDARATLERILRSCAYLVLPIAAGGWVVADALLVRLFGHGYSDAAWTLRWLLLAAVLLGVGSRFGNTLFARREHARFLLPLVVGMTTNLTLSLLLIPAWGSAGTALGTVAGVGLSNALALLLLRRRMAFSALAPLTRPALVAALVALATWLVPPNWGALSGVAVGGLVFAVAIYHLELRGRWTSLGAGLERGSGFLPG